MRGQDGMPTGVAGTTTSTTRIDMDNTETPGDLVPVTTETWGDASPNSRMRNSAQKAFVLAKVRPEGESRVLEVTDMAERWQPTQLQDSADVQESPNMSITVTVRSVGVLAVESSKGGARELVYLHGEVLHLVVSSSESRRDLNLTIQGIQVRCPTLPYHPRLPSSTAASPAT
ncbi:hypothetical protein CYMTET_35130 [Cymbomonas tetramitiformis]|uniref:Uncharacterized protein n=1 Tax=Cymbomonas tetramitiformis TaxID=36881 RepID=A0AAE0F9X4_9CHLO|nr:hypothetical protein CYMTET_35130 [Cymbomonas tetramitiformis]